MMKMKKILWMTLLGLGAVTIIAYHLGLGPYRPRFPVTSGESGEPYPALNPEQGNLMAEVRAIGLLRDRSRLMKVLSALKEEHPLIVINALLALGRLEVPETTQELVALQAKLPENSELQPFIALALARIEAGKAVPLVRDREQLKAKVEHFLKAAKVSLRQVYKGALWYGERLRLRQYPRWAPFEVQVLRQAAEIVGEAYKNGVDDAFEVVAINFSLEHAAQLKAKLSKMNKGERIKWLVDSLSKKRVLKGEDRYEIQALVDEGTTALEAIADKLREMRMHRDRYHYIGFAALFDTLASINAPEAIPIVKSFLNDNDKWVRYYADQALWFLERDWPIVGGIDY